ncbi:MAG: aminotransferase class V-fold PLP-dependent enzyme [Desulfurococcales archaeon]|nr:aminotransferase class V-fold PLP-dependent enzyme [Desulfurococcales archaeon]
MNKPKLLTPGPVEVGDKVLYAQAQKMISHRGRLFQQVYSETTGMLEEMSNAEEALIYAGSGTTAVDAMIWSLIEPGSNVLVIVTGEFGRRLEATIRARGVEVMKLESNPGEPVEPYLIQDAIDKYKPDYLAIVHNETSTGLAYRNLEKIAQYASEAGAKTLVDTVSGFPAEKLELNKTGIFAAATCSHKALAAPPGLAINLLSREAVKYLEKTDPPGIPPSINLYKNHKFYLERRETPYTPPVTLIQALQTSLTEIMKKEMNKFRVEHEERASILYGKLPELGFRTLVSKKEYRSNTVTAFYTPENVGAKQIATYLLEKGYNISTGIGKLKDNVVRIGIMGHITREDLYAILRELESVTHT